MRNKNVHHNLRFSSLQVFNDRFPKKQCAETKFADHILSQPQI